MFSAISVFKQLLTPNSVSFAYHPKLENKYIHIVILRYFSVFPLFVNDFCYCRVSPSTRKYFFPFLLSSNSVVTVLQESCVLVHLHLAMRIPGPYVSLGSTDKNVFKSMACEKCLLGHTGHLCAGDAWDCPVLCHYTWLLWTIPEFSTADVNVVWRTSKAPSQATAWPSCVLPS